MKSKFMTILVVAGVLGSIVLINKNEPSRVAQQQEDEAKKAYYELKAAADLEAHELEMAELEAAELAKAGTKSDETMKENSGNGVVHAAETTKKNAVAAPIAIPMLIAAPAGGANDYTVVFDCSNGRIVIEVKSELAPLGAKQFKKAIEDGVYNEARFFRVLPGFMVQFGIPGNPSLASKWNKMSIMDDPVKIANKRGTVSFATGGPNSRTTQVFINYGDNSKAPTQLDKQGFSPFGRVIEGMNVADAIFSGHKQIPNQGRIQSQGNVYLNKNFPELDYIKKAFIVKPGGVIPAPAKDEAKK